MRHPRYHEEPVEFLDFIPSLAYLPARFNACQLRPDTVVVVDAVCRRDCGVRPPDIVDDLGAMCPQRSEVGIGCIENWPEVFIGERDISCEIERMEVPIRILEKKIREEPVSEELLQCLACTVRKIGIAGGSGDPGLPIGGVGLAARLIAGEDELSGGGVVRATIDP